MSPNGIAQELQPAPDPNTTIALTVADLNLIIQAYVAQAHAQDAMGSAASAMARYREQVAPKKVEAPAPSKSEKTQ
jgi:hypothetical protein